MQHQSVTVYDGRGRYREVDKAKDDAEIVTSKGTFEAVGDASAENVGEGIAIHLVRMSETRAIARALRWATNSASTAMEEVDQSHPTSVFDNRPRQTPGGNGERSISTKQIALITRLLREQNRRQDEFRTEISDRFGGRSLEQLSVQEASSVIEDLMAAA